MGQTLANLKKSILACAILVSVLFFGSCEKPCTQQAPNPNCICTMDYTPVCGCDNITYSNACSAECAGITNYTTGECN